VIRLIMMDQISVFLCIVIMSDQYLGRF